MDFSTDIFTLYPPNKKSFSLVGVSLPTNTDIYFRAKQKELLDQYAGARIYLRQTDNENWDYWFNPDPNSQNNQAFQYIFTGYFYEAALMYYNIIVDLSWTICYTSAEFACTQNGMRVDFSGLKSIEEAATLLRKAENNVTTPTAENNPFAYLKMMCPEFSNAIDMIVAFWNRFADSDIRRNYNYCKHKGKPAYKEICKLQGGRLMGLYVQPVSKALRKEMVSDIGSGSPTIHSSAETNDRIQIASDIRDVQLQISLKDAIEALQLFDDNSLFPYIKDLLEELERVIKPSPLV